MKVLLIGALPPPIGGTTVLLQQLVNEVLEYPDIQVDIVNTARNRSTPLQNTLTGFCALFRILRRIPGADVISFHTSVQGALLFGPVIHCFCRVFQKRWIFRGFGGDFDAWHQNAPALASTIFTASALRADAILFERQSSTIYFQQLTDRPVIWYANSRKWDPAVKPSTPRTIVTARRFVYVGHLKKEKGIAEIIEATQLLSGSYTVDIYGPPDPGFTVDTLRSNKVSYKGPLDPSRVVRTLARYDVLLLPTYWKGEGYPGVILEAYCAGIPVIASRWGGIPEIVSDKSGILIEPRNSRALAEAMNVLIKSSERMHELRSGAAVMAQRFSSTAWTKTFVDVCRSLTALDKQGELS